MLVSAPPRKKPNLHQRMKLAGKRGAALVIVLAILVLAVLIPVYIGLHLLMNRHS